MAERADGTVYINSSIDTTGFKPGGKEIEAACKRMAKSVADMGNKVKTHTQEIAVTLVQQNRLYAEQADKVEKLKQQMEELREQKVTTTEFQKLEKQIVKDSEDLEKMISLQKEFVEMGGSKEDSYYTNLQARIEQLGNKIEEAKKKKDDLMQSGEAYTGETVNTADTEEYRNAVKEYEAELANLNKLGMGVQASFARLAQKVQQFGGTVSGVYRLKGALEELKNIGKMVIHPIQTVKDAFSLLVYRIKDSAAGLGASVINGLLHPFQTLKSLAVPALSKLGSAAKSAAKSIGSKLVTSLKKAASAALGVKKHTNGVGHSFKQMLKYSLGIRSLYTLFNRVRSAVKDGLKNLAQYSSETNKSISALKSSMTQLKNSLATAFAPILTVIEPILTKFISLLSQAITYVGMFFAAFTGQKSFTKAVAVQEDYAASLGDTADGAKEAQKYLSGLDEIRTYSEDKDTSVGGNGSVEPSQMFETVDMPGFVGDWVQKFKDAWNNADFTELGSLIGTKIKNTLDNIPWEGIKENARKIGTSIAALINGYVETPELFSSMGKTVGESINTAIVGAKAFLSTTKFAEIGRSVANFLNSALKTIEWGELAETISLGIEGILDLIIGFLDEVDWELLADSIWEFLKNIDWGGIFGRLGLLILELMRAEFSFGNQLGQDITSSLAEFFKEIGWNSVGEFFEGLEEKIKENGENVKIVFQNVIDWVKEKLGINSPSTVFAEIGRYVVEGFINGIADAINGKKEWIKEHIFDPFINGFKSVFGIHSPSTVMMEMGVFLIQGLLDGIVSLISSVRAKFEEIKNIISTKFTETKQKMIETWNSAKTSLSTIWNTIKITATNVFNSIKTTISNIWNGIVSTIKESINSIIGFINGMISGIVSGINSIINAMNSLHFDVPDWVPVLGGKSFGFSIPTISAPQIPYLATGAVIPPNAPFMAVLGDQKHGTNIEAPLSLIEDSVNKAVQNAMSKQQRGGTYIFEAQLDRRTIFRQVIEEAKLRQTVTGRNPFELA